MKIYGFEWLTETKWNSAVVAAKTVLQARKVLRDKIGKIEVTSMSPGRAWQKESCPRKWKCPKVLYLCLDGCESVY